MKQQLLMRTGECEHCKEEVLYEGEQFKVEQTKRGKSLLLYGSCTRDEAVEEYNRFRATGRKLSARS